MKVIIIGCGKLGSGLARNLTRKGHHVTVIDKNSDTFSMLGKDFPGKTITGVEFDKEILEKAQIRYADAVVACSKSDETNALIGRIAKNIYKVPRVISRLYDPRKAELYQTLGIQTISTTGWGISRAAELLSYNQLDSVMSIGHGETELVRIEVPALLVGRKVGELDVVGEIQVVALSRDNKTFLPTMGTALQQRDVIYLSVMHTSITRLKSMLGLS